MTCNIYAVSTTLKLYNVWFYSSFAKPILQSILLKFKYLLLKFDNYYVLYDVYVTAFIRRKWIEPVYRPKWIIK